MRIFPNSFLRIGSWPFRPTGPTRNAGPCWRGAKWWAFPRCNVSCTKIRPWRSITVFLKICERNSRPTNPLTSCLSTWEPRRTRFRLPRLNPASSRCWRVTAIPTWADATLIWPLVTGWPKSLKTSTVRNCRPNPWRSQRRASRFWRRPRRPRKHCLRRESRKPVSISKCCKMILTFTPSSKLPSTKKCVNHSWIAWKGPLSNA
mmetsp:Transcript_12725/g.27915  ORF Transcript_12725/g.27915 Transcript_12725/m.27915 type:complete len:204 (+) Transcript_12725:409-1020(+)